MNDYQNIVNAKISVYEAYDEGIITESEKDNLLYIIEEATSEDDKTNTKKKIKKAIIIAGLLSILAGILIATSDARTDKIYKINKNNKNYHEIKKISDDMVEIKAKLKSLEKEVSLSPGRTLTDKGREDVDKYINDLKLSYKKASSLFSEMSDDVKNRESKDQYNKANTIMAELTHLFNTI